MRIKNKFVIITGSILLISLALLVGYANYTNYETRAVIASLKRDMTDKYKILKPIDINYYILNDQSKDIIVVEDGKGGFFIKTSKSATFFYPVTKNNQVTWKCLGYPSNEMPVECRD